MYSEKILGYGKELYYKQKNFDICKDFYCMNKHMQKCERAYLNLSQGFQWQDAFIKGYANKICIYEVKKFNGTGYICKFDGETLTYNLVNEMFGCHRGERQNIIKNCTATGK